MILAYVLRNFICRNAVGAHGLRTAGRRRFRVRKPHWFRRAAVGLEWPSAPGLRCLRCGYFVVRRGQLIPVSVVPRQHWLAILRVWTTLDSSNYAIWCALPTGARPAHGYFVR